MAFEGTNVYLLMRVDIRLLVHIDIPNPSNHPSIHYRFRLLFIRTSTQLPRAILPSGSSSPAIPSPSSCPNFPLRQSRSRSPNLPKRPERARNKNHAPRMTLLNRGRVNIKQRIKHPRREPTRHKGHSAHILPTQHASHTTDPAHTPDLLGQDTRQHGRDEQRQILDVVLVRGLGALETGKCGWRETFLQTLGCQGRARVCVVPGWFWL